MAQGFTGSDKNSLLNGICEGRLTLSSGTPVTSVDTSNTVLYFTPYKGNRIFLYNTATSKWELTTFTEKSISIPATTNTNYDVFIYDNSGVLTLELVAWTSDTVRSVSVVLQDGVYVKSGDSSRRYLGTVRTGATSGQVEDTITQRYLWNYYNRVKRKLYKQVTTDSWTYNGTTWRALNNDTNHKVELVIGVAEEEVEVLIGIAIGNLVSGVNENGYVGIGVDTTSTNSADIVISGSRVPDSQGSGLGVYRGVLSNGYHYLMGIETVQSGSTLNFYGDAGTTNILQGGISGYIKG